MTVVPEAAPRSAAAEDLVILPAEYGITSELRHAVNNPLTAVLGYAELLERVEGLAPEVRARVEKILQYGRQVRDLVRRPGDIA